MSGAPARECEPLAALQVRVRGTVQGVGLRPTVWRIARELGLSGEVLNDGAGVLIRAAGDREALEALLARLPAEAPRLARIEALEPVPWDGPLGSDDFRIAPSRAGETRTGVAPDAALCPACRAEVLSPFERRFRYPFASCTHCGPRLSIVREVPFDRPTTTLAPFPLCDDCAREYADPADRRFHAQATACHACGPRAWLERLDGRAVSFDRHGVLDEVDAAGGLIRKGEILAVKGLGGFQLACDATNAEAVGRLRARKRRDTKPFALMARDLEVVRRYCTLGPDEEALLESAEGPIVLLPADGPERLPDAVAPGLDTLGFMLPTTPLHLLMLRRLDRPVVMTSGNLSDEPQATDNIEARERLAGIADCALMHDREVANRVDDSVVRVAAGAPRVLRRARGYAPAAIPLPPGLEAAPDLLAYGGELKAAFCLVKDGAAILSQHQGDLEEASTFEDYCRNLDLFARLYDQTPRLLACDRHPEYLSTKLARETAEETGRPLLEVQHHHAHVASCLAENGVPLGEPPVLGIALDGLGYGDGGEIWGGEFLLADYRAYRRLGTFKPVAMLGGAQAIREPWRNAYAHIVAGMGWPTFAMNFSQLELFRFLEEKPRATLDAMLARGLNAPPASSCGRLFDAVAAALGLARERAGHEGEGAMRLEAAVDRRTLEEEDEALAYPMAIPNLPGSGLPCLEPLGLWQALLGDLTLGTPLPVMAARFHKGLAKAIAAMAARLAGEPRRFARVALTGGCFHNRVLTEQAKARLEALGFEVLLHARVPAGDGGLALGQAAIAAARSLEA